ncbi:MAG: DUF72 domain-containing protein [Pseudomonadota bacterium]|nr:DUF72 domain-containing protein [Pseudomonadota bacterium]
MQKARIRIGISGWQYAPWRGTFYPKDLPQRCELQYASGLLPIIEINGTFYALQKPQSYAKWYAETPVDFVFALKGPRFITHIKRLQDVGKPLANFFASGIFNLKEKLGPILWQFAPNFKYDEELMRGFLALLPRDTTAASRLAKAREPFMKGRTRLAVDANRTLRYAIEIRNESFVNASFIRLLREYQVALVIAESARRWPMIQDVTADFLYLRLHGDKQLYRSGYSEKSLQGWAARIAAWHRGGEPPDAAKVLSAAAPGRRRRDIYCFFDNTDVKLRAPFDAQSLMGKLGVRRGAAT